MSVLLKQSTELSKNPPIFKSNSKLKYQGIKMFEMGLECCRSENGEYEKALMYFEKALAAKKFKFGPDHHEVLYVHLEIADVLTKLGRFQDAEFHYKISKCQYDSFHSINRSSLSKNESRENKAGRVNSNYATTTSKISQKRQNLRHHDAPLFDPTSVYIVHPKIKSKILGRRKIAQNGLSDSYLDLFKNC